MARLAAAMPVVTTDAEELKPWGVKWLARKATAEIAAKAKFDAKEATRRDKALAKGRPFAAKVFDPSTVSGAFARDESVQFATMFDRAFGKALSVFLGGIPVVPPAGDSLLPPQADCVEVGATRIVGGIRPQNYDAAYRPDGPRVVLDSKSLNDRKSIGIARARQRAGDDREGPRQLADLLGLHAASDGAQPVRHSIELNCLVFAKLRDALTRAESWHVATATDAKCRA